MNILQRSFRRLGILRLISLWVMISLVGCSTATTTRQKVTRAAIISGGAAAAITLALGGDAGEAIAIGVGVAAVAGGVVYVRNELSVGRANAAKAEAELARLRAENSSLAQTIERNRGTRLAAFQVGATKSIVVVDMKSGKAVERAAKTSSGELTKVPVGFELSNIPAEPGEQTNVAYRTGEGEGDRSFGVVYLGKI